MNFLEIKAELESQFNSWATANHPTIKILWENATLNDTSGWFFAINILPGASTDVEVGPGAAILSQGLMNIRVVGPTGVGSGQAFTYSSAIAEAFENKRFNHIVTDAASMNVVGESENKFVSTVSINWRAYR